MVLKIIILQEILCKCFILLFLVILALKIICRNNEVGLIDENLIFSQENMKKCEDFLNNILKSDKIPNMITFTCFPALTESSSNIEFKWSQSISISKEEFLSQIHYELAIYYFYREDYNQAKIHFTNSMENYKNTYNNVGFLTISLPVLESYIVACDPQSNMKNTLLHHLRISVATQFTVSFSLKFLSEFLSNLILGFIKYSITR